MRAHGAGVLRALVVLAGFAFIGYVAARLLAVHPAAVVYWFVGSAVAHDLVVFPLYAITDALVVRLLRRRPSIAAVRGIPWLNHLRFPAAISGILLLVWLPLIARLPSRYEAITGLSTDPYLGRWIAVTGVLFALSGAAYAARLCRARGDGQPQGGSAGRERE